MTPSSSLQNVELIGRGANAEVYAWGRGQVLKLFFEHHPAHEKEEAATRAAYRAGLPVPRVIDGLIEVGDREGIVFERIDGPGMNAYLENHPSELESCARQAAELLARIHATKCTEVAPSRQSLVDLIERADPLDEETRQVVLDTLNGLPIEDARCHGDFHPENIIMSERGPVVIDWGNAGRENPLIDYARARLILLWLPDFLKEPHAPEPDPLLTMFLRQFADVLCQRYEQLRPTDRKSFLSWQMVAATLSLVLDGSVVSDDRRVSFIKAVVNGAEHPWL